MIRARALKIHHLLADDEGLAPAQKASVLFTPPVIRLRRPKTKPKNNRTFWVREQYIRYLDGRPVGGVHRARPAAARVESLSPPIDSAGEPSDGPHADGGGGVRH
eukprot:6454959-Pyramimonas_sp.AAC.1